MNNDDVTIQHYQLSMTKPKKEYKLLMMKPMKYNKQVFNKVLFKLKTLIESF